MDLSYTIIPAATGGMVRLYREVERMYHVEVPNRLENGEEVMPHGHPPHSESEFVYATRSATVFHSIDHPLLLVERETNFSLTDICNK